MCEHVDEKKCNENFLHCQACYSFCKKTFNAQKQLINNYLKSLELLTNEKLEDLHSRGNILFKGKQFSHDCYKGYGSGAGLTLTAIKYLTRGGAGNIYKRCDTTEKYCFIYKVMLQPPGLKDNALEINSIKFYEYLGKHPYIKIDRLCIIKEYTSYNCPKDPPSIVSIIDYAGGGDLNKLLKEYDLPVCVFRNIIFQIIVALEYWGDYYINHNDLKCDNIFLQVSDIPKPRFRFNHHNYEVYDYGIVPLLADYDWTTFGLPHEKRHVNDRILSSNHRGGWRGQSSSFDPYYDVFSFLSELVQVLYNYKKMTLLHDIIQFVMVCTGIHAVTLEEFLTIVQPRMYRRYMFNKDVYPKTKTPKQILKENPYEYFSIFLKQDK